MREFQQKRKIKRIVYSKVSLVLLTIILIVVARATWGVYAKEKESSQNKKEADMQLQALKQRENTLTADIAKLKTTAGVEQDIRQNFRMAKSGEQLAIILDSSKTVTPLPQQNFWQKIWSSIKGIFGR